MRSGNVLIVRRRRRMFTRERWLAPSTISTEPPYTARGHSASNPPLRSFSKDSHLAEALAPLAVALAGAVLGALDLDVAALAVETRVAEKEKNAALASVHQHTQTNTYT